MQAAIFHQITDYDPLMSFSGSCCNAVASQSDKIHMANARNDFDFVGEALVAGGRAVLESLQSHVGAVGEDAFVDIAVAASADDVISGEIFGRSPNFIELEFDQSCARFNGFKSETPPARTDKIFTSAATPLAPAPAEKEPNPEYEKEEQDEASSSDAVDPRIRRG